MPLYPFGMQRWQGFSCCKNFFWWLCSENNGNKEGSGIWWYSVICIDQVTNKRTSDCDHTFCFECTEQHFTFKKACPSCGEVLGIQILYLYLFIRINKGSAVVRSAFFQELNACFSGITLFNWVIKKILQYLQNIVIYSDFLIWYCLKFMIDAGS